MPWRSVEGKFHIPEDNGDQFVIDSLNSKDLKIDEAFTISEKKGGLFLFRKTLLAVFARIIDEDKASIRIYRRIEPLIGVGKFDHRSRVLDHGFHTVYREDVTVLQGNRLRGIRWLSHEDLQLEAELGLKTGPNGKIPNRTFAGLI